MADYLTPMSSEMPDIVVEHVVTPTTLTKEQKNMLAKLADSLGTPDVPEDPSLFSRIRDAFAP